jgi:hypothetical protein
MNGWAIIGRPDGANASAEFGTLEEDECGAARSEHIHGLRRPTLCAASSETAATAVRFVSVNQFESIREIRVKELFWRRKRSFILAN